MESCRRETGLFLATKSPVVSSIMPRSRLLKTGSIMATGQEQQKTKRSVMTWRDWKSLLKRVLWALLWPLVFVCFINGLHWGVEEEIKFAESKNKGIKFIRFRLRESRAIIIQDPPYKQAFIKHHSVWQDVLHFLDYLLYLLEVRSWWCHRFIRRAAWPGRVATNKQRVDRRN